MIDLHCHVLPGIDDGPQSIEGSLALARAAVAAGIDTLVATPHVSSRYRNDSENIARLVGELNTRLLSEEVELEVRAGAEIAMTSLAELDPGELARLGLGGGQWLLVEPPFTEVARGLDAVLLEFQRSGHRILLAHPERCRAFHREPRMLESLVRGGVLTSITAGSLIGRFGREVRRFALQLARDGMIHNVTSDAHDHDQRPPGLARELEQAGLGGDLAQWLTDAVPTAILSGGEIPRRPSQPVLEVEPTRRRWRLRR
jgi:protein-tyrosine phosphatase